MKHAPRPRFVDATIGPLSTISDMVQDILTIDFSSGQMASSESATPISGFVAESAVTCRKESQRKARERLHERDWETSLYWLPRNMWDFW